MYFLCFSIDRLLRQILLGSSRFRHKLRGWPLQILWRFTRLGLFALLIQKFSHFVFVNAWQHNRLNTGFVHLSLFMWQELSLHLVGIIFAQLMHHVVILFALRIIQTFVTPHLILVLLQKQRWAWQLIFPFRFQHRDCHRLLLPIKHLLPLSLHIFVGNARWFGLTMRLLRLEVVLRHGSDIFVGWRACLMMHLQSQLCRSLNHLQRVIELLQGLWVNHRFRESHLRKKRLITFFIVFRVVKHFVVNVVQKILVRR